MIDQRFSQPLPDACPEGLLRISRQIAAKSGEQFFSALAQALAEELSASLVSIGRTQDGREMRTLALATPKGCLDNVRYLLPESPCEEAIQQTLCVVQEGLQQQYPKDPMLRFTHFEAYIGVRLFSSKGELFGVMCARFQEPLDESEAELAQLMLSIYALRVSSEMERLLTEKELLKTEYYANQIFNNSPLAMLVLNLDGSIARFNQAFCRLSGLHADDVMGLNALNLFHRDHVADIQSRLDQLIGQQVDYFKIESSMCTPARQHIEVLLDSYVLKNYDNSIRNMVFQIEDISSRKNSERQIQKLSQAVELSPVAIVVTNPQSEIEYVNPRFTQLTGYTHEESLGRHTNLNASGQTPREIYQDLWNTISQKRQWQGELLNRRKDGSTYWARTTIFPIIDQHQRITNYVSLQEDISDAKQLSRQLEYEATHDQLTGLINRAEFKRRLEQAIDQAREGGQTHSLCFLDLDQFKVLNDTSGHIAGDALLTRIGKILQNHVRTSDTAARVGGDEFALILGNCNVDKAQEITEKIRQAIDSLNFMWEDKIHSLGVSVGITPITGEITDTTELMKQVDTACYSAKDDGRNCIHIYREDNRNVSRRRQETDWVPELTTALKEERFQLFGQKIIALKDEDRKPSYEILIRLVDRQGKLVPPGEFLPSAERYGLSPRVDRCVFDHLNQWLQDNPSALEATDSFAINLSGTSISNHELLEHIIRTIKAGDVPPGKFKFEITETSAITNIVEACHFMQKLRTIGCSLVLDDFGRGLSSFAYLKNLPVDVLKIDGLFVKEILKNQADFTMVKMINELAHSLGIQTIAEYIENEEVLNCVRGMGVDFAQGYSIARPQNLSELFAAPLPAGLSAASPGQGGRQDRLQL